MQLPNNVVGVEIDLVVGSIVVAVVTVAVVVVVAVTVVFAGSDDDEANS